MGGRLALRGVGAVSGLIGLAYNIIRFRWDQGADHRAAQAALRQQVRQIVHEARTAAESVRTALSSGKEIGSVDPRVEGAYSKLESLRPLVDYDPNKLLMFGAQTKLLASQWERLHRHDTSDYLKMTDREARATEDDVSRNVQQVIELSGAVFSDLQALDRGKKLKPLYPPKKR